MTPDDVADREVSWAVSRLVGAIERGQLHPWGYLSALKDSQRVVVAAMGVCPDEDGWDDYKKATFTVVGGLVASHDAVVIAFDSRAREDDGTAREAVTGVTLWLDGPELTAKAIIQPYQGRTIGTPYMPDEFAMETLALDAILRGAAKGPLDPISASTYLSELGHQAAILGPDGEEFIVQKVTADDVLEMLGLAKRPDPRLN